MPAIGTRRCSGPRRWRRTGPCCCRRRRTSTRQTRHPCCGCWPKVRPAQYVRRPRPRWPPSWKDPSRTSPSPPTGTARRGRLGVLACGVASLTHGQERVDWPWRTGLPASGPTKTAFVPLSLRVAGTVRALHTAVIAAVEAEAAAPAGQADLAARLKLLTLLVRQTTYDRLRPGLPTAVVSAAQRVFHRSIGTPPAGATTGSKRCGLRPCGLGATDRTERIDATAGAAALEVLAACAAVTAGATGGALPELAPLWAADHPEVGAGQQRQVGQVSAD